MHKTIVLSGLGINCEQETAWACHLAGFTDVQTVSIQQLYAHDEAEPIDWNALGFLILPGGFLDGDDLGAGHACAKRFTYRKMADGSTIFEKIQQFVEAGGLLLGICNGFQLLMQLGFLDPLVSTTQAEAEATTSISNALQNTPPQLSLTANQNACFEDRWVQLSVSAQSPCVFTKGLNQLHLPVRHGEGRLECSIETLQALAAAHLLPLQYCNANGTPTQTYPHNPNGSPLGAAAVCNSKGNVLGLMPHPEAYVHFTHHPSWTRLPAPPSNNPNAWWTGDGLKLFQNAYQHLNR